MFKNFLSYKPTLFSDLPLRLMIAAIFIFHGYGKINGIEGTAGFFASVGLEPSLPLAYLAAYGEFLGGVLIGLGLFTRLAALNCMVIIGVAIASVHWGQGYKGMEFQLLILVSSLQLLISGAGSISLDKIIRDKI